MNIISKYTQLENPKVVGLMSGTSADAIDAALVEVLPKPKLISFSTHPLTNQVKERLQAIFENRSDPQEITRMHWLLGELFAKVALDVLDGGKADLIASHGQTVCHLPTASLYCGHKVRGTLQIGEGAVIAERTGCLTVCDFRPQDMACKGQGAPLVPWADKILFGNSQIDTIALNIGGMSNITWIPKTGNILAFDTGPGNVISDAICRHFYDLPCDFDGKVAFSGKVIPEILGQLMQHEYLYKPFPKSTGREEFGATFAASLFEKGAPEDLVRTAIAFTAQSICFHLESLVKDNAQLVVGGGGVCNPCLMQELNKRLPRNIKMGNMEDFGVPAQAREAIAFALLGHETIYGRPSNVILSTGADHPCILGKIILPPPQFL